MFSYYGSKSKIVKYYPPPEEQTIIEPFAGSARYSLLYWYKKIILYEKYDVIVNIWKWLQRCTEADIQMLPDMKAGDCVDDFKFSCIEAKHLMGFSINQGSASPKKTVSPIGNFGNLSDKFKQNIISHLDHIRTWEIRQGDYREAPDICATWFIDPPYQKGGKYYRHNKIDYPSLAEWCKARRGQVIVCEHSDATWLPFLPLKEMSGSRRKTMEAIWTNGLTGSNTASARQVKTAAEATQ